MKKNSKVCIFPLLLSFLLMVSNSCKKDIIPIETSTVTDIDGNIYKTLKIGNQWWMGENLKTTKFNNGTNIPNPIEDNIWNNLHSSGYCWYQNNNTYKDQGALYNWYALSDIRNIAPIGWHVPTYAEWTTFKNYLSSEHISSGEIENAGFSFMSVGIRSGRFTTTDIGTQWWSTTEKTDGFISIQSFTFNNSSYSTNDYVYKSDGYSVRCVKD